MINLIGIQVGRHVLDVSVDLIKGEMFGSCVTNLDVLIY